MGGMNRSCCCVEQDPCNNGWAIGVNEQFSDTFINYITGNIVDISKWTASVDPFISLTSTFAKSIQYSIPNPVLPLTLNGNLTAPLPLLSSDVFYNGVSYRLSGGINTRRVVDSFEVSVKGYFKRPGNLYPPLHQYGVPCAWPSLEIRYAVDRNIYFGVWTFTFGNGTYFDWWNWAIETDTTTSFIQFVVPGNLIPDSQQNIMRLRAVRTSSNDTAPFEWTAYVNDNPVGSALFRFGDFNMPPGEVRCFVPLRIWGTLQYSNDHLANGDVDASMLPAIDYVKVEYN